MSLSSPAPFRAVPQAVCSMHHLFGISAVQGDEHISRWHQPRLGHRDRDTGAKGAGSPQLCPEAEHELVDVASAEGSPPRSPQTLGAKDAPCSH